MAGLGDVITEAVYSQINSLMVKPQKIRIPISDWTSALDSQENEIPVGVLRVQIFEAKAIKNVDVTGISDPMALIFLGGKKVAQTRCLKNTLYPQWYSRE
jgi:Ca2+-dependent lipid-binding protein